MSSKDHGIIKVNLTYHTGRISAMVEGAVNEVDDFFKKIDHNTPIMEIVYEVSKFALTCHRAFKLLSSPVIGRSVSEIIKIEGEEYIDEEMLRMGERDGGEEGKEMAQKGIDLFNTMRAIVRDEGDAKA